MNAIIEENDQTRVRREHLEAIERLVGNAYPNKFVRSCVTGDEDTISAVVEKFKSYAPQLNEGERPTPEQLEAANAELNKISVRVAGRIATPPRVMGKAAFVHLSDGKARLQIYVRRDDVRGVRNDAEASECDGWELFKLLDHGDFIGVGGYLFVTKTGELSVHVETIQFLAKALLPMPDKMHGIADPEIRRRQCYADLIADSLKIEREANELSTREVFERRYLIIREMRRYLDEHGYIEVETPMLAPQATGAAARPFVTHHNALDIDLYARIAPELYLKRLLVGGFERVYELNRNFRNEGIDATHNPEFTMLEFYCAYMDVNGMMDFCEAMIRDSVVKATGGTKVNFGNQEIDFNSKFPRLSMKQAIAHTFSNFGRIIGEEINEDWLDDSRNLRVFDFYANSFRDSQEGDFRLAVYSTEEEQKGNDSDVRRRWLEAKEAAAAGVLCSEYDEVEAAHIIELLFAEFVEDRLIQPTFITDFPKAVSPLSKASPENPQVAERFELFIAGIECANGFSELNDPQEQRARFEDQMRERERGDEEAMVLDEDYIRALSYGMPPAAGIGIGIDRLVMLLTNRRSIRDVILFPHMRPERKASETNAAETNERESAE